MEIVCKIPSWLNKDHPNYLRWERARQLSLDRGKFVRTIIENVTDAKNLYILDIGSGEGGTTKIFSVENFVVSIDISKIRLLRQKLNYNLDNSICSDATLLPFKDSSFDLIILQDVIEHIVNKEILLSEINRLLRISGMIYLSTPNRLSALNILSDPHWGIPCLSLFNRDFIKKFFLRIFRKPDYNRKDIPQLLSFSEIKYLFEKNFEISLFTTLSVCELFNGNKGIAWSSFHIKLIALLKKLRLDHIIKKIANDNFGFINKYFTPTFYLVMKKKLN